MAVVTPFLPVKIQNEQNLIKHIYALCIEMLFHSIEQQYGNYIYQPIIIRINLIVYIVKYIKFHYFKSMRTFLKS